MTQFGPIWRLRRALVRNRLADLSSRRRASAAVLLAGAAAALLVGGHLAAPILMEPPVDLATPRGLHPDDLPAGAAALEASFWLSALLASVLNFRVMELLFRRADIVALQVLPIEAPALFFDRFFATATEAVVAAAAASLFFVPLFWHGESVAALASMAMLFGGLLIGATVSLVVMLRATRQLIPKRRESGGNRPPLTDAYGGSGQLLLYAPAFALGGVVVLALFWKLLLGEPLRLGYFSEPFWIGTAILAAVSAACLAIAFRTFVSDYHAMAPRFHETDAADFSAVADYQSSSFDQPRRWELGLGRGAARAYRALALDDDRRLAGGRVGYAVVLIVAVIFIATVELAALPLWAAAMVPAVLSAGIVNPWHRLATRIELIDTPLGLPVSALNRQRAADRAALREFLYIGLPYAIAAAVILAHFRGLGADGLLVGLTALSSGFGIAGGVSIARQFGALPSAVRWLPAALLAALTATAITSLTAAATASAVVFIASVVARKFHVER